MMKKNEIVYTTETPANPTNVDLDSFVEAMNLWQDAMVEEMRIQDVLDNQPLNGWGDIE